MARSCVLFVTLFVALAAFAQGTATIGSSATRAAAALTAAYAATSVSMPSYSTMDEM